MAHPPDSTTVRGLAPAEQEVAALALALVPEGVILSEPEAAIRQQCTVPPCAEALAAVRHVILEGADPLGERLLQSRSAEQRRPVGQVFTPPEIVQSMVSRASDDARDCGSFCRVIDPGAGSGRFTLHAAAAFPHATALAIEPDPLSALILRATAAARGFLHRVQVMVDDYLTVQIPAASGRTLFIGNPPYVRHHSIGPEAKSRYVSVCRRLGAAGASQLAGMHLHFLLRTAELADRGDLAIFITSAEWLDTNYGRPIRRLFCGPLGLDSLHIVDARCQVFPGVLTTGAVTVYRPGTEASMVRVQEADSVAALNRLAGGRAVSAAGLAAATRWRCLCSQSMTAHGSIRGRTCRVGDVFRVSRGQVTGCNSVWIVHTNTPRLPPSCLIPCVTGAEDIFSAHANHGRLDNVEALHRVVSIPPDFSALDGKDITEVGLFLRWAQERGADRSYVARHRSPWWAVRFPAPAPIVCTYMARRPPVFIRNEAGAALLNIAHGLYPRVALDPSQLDLACESLNQCVRLSDGRGYAGGLVKFEPKMVEDLLFAWDGPCPQRQTELALALCEEQPA